MRILVSNDDGIAADGINFLFEELLKSNDVTMIAPNKERSGCGHGLTLGEPIRLKSKGPNRYSCTGLPADCILLGLGHVLKSKLPELVVTGINHGANMGQDRFYSGTLAAAREAALREIPSIGVSLVTKAIKDVEHFETAALFIRKIVDQGIHKLIPKMCLLNINIPNLPREKISGVELTFSGHQLYSEEVVERVDARGNTYYWVGGRHQGHRDIAGSDCNAVDEGKISVELQVLNNEQRDLSQLRDFFEN